MKKNIALAVIAILMAACTACTEKQPPKPIEDEPAPVEITIDPRDDKGELDDWRLLLVNRNNPLKGELPITLKTVDFGYLPSRYKVDSRVYEPLKSLFESAKKDGITLCLVSGYRSIEKQQQLYDNKIDYYVNRGYSHEDAVRLTEEVLSIPGRSEHHTGLAADIVCDTYTDLDDGFADTKAGRWLAEHCYDFGFIIRYPKDKEDITMITYEPWHLRFVGTEYARIIKSHGFCLEEYREYSK